MPLQPLRKEQVEQPPSGVWTPTLANVANVDIGTTSIGDDWQYIRVGNFVFFTGNILVDPTLSGTLTKVSFTLPFSPDFTDSYQLNGNVTATDAFGSAIGNATSEKGEIWFESVKTGIHYFRVVGSYRTVEE